MTRDEAYRVAEKLAFIDFAPQWILRRVQDANVYKVLSVSDPADIVSYLWIVDNYLDPKNADGQGSGWAIPHE